MTHTDYGVMKVGIVGAGLMGRWHSNVITRLGASVEAILDTNQPLANKLSQQLKSRPTVFTSIDDMLANAELDVLHICTPVESHFPLSLKAIEAGINIIVEKPLAITAFKTKELLEAARAKNLKICPVHQFGFQDGVRKALSELDSLGELLHLRFTTSSAGGVGQTVNTLNDIIADVIPHPLSVLQRIRPDISLDSSQWEGIQPMDGELQVIGDADGIGIDIYVSMNSRPTRCEMELYCTDGRIILNFFHGYALIEKGNVSRIQKLTQPFKFSLNQFFVASKNIIKRGLSGEQAYPGLYHLIEKFYFSVKSKTESPISSEEILSVAQVRDDLNSRFLNNKN